MTNTKPVREEALQMVAELTGDSVGYIRMQIGTHGRFVTLETVAVSMAERALKAEAANREQIRSLFAENESPKAQTKGWLMENAPGGWIDELRADCERIFKLLRWYYARHTCDPECETCKVVDGLILEGK